MICNVDVVTANVVHGSGGVCFELMTVNYSWADAFWESCEPKSKLWLDYHQITGAIKQQTICNE